jgi:hypothetical protein
MCMGLHALLASQTQSAHVQCWICDVRCTAVLCTRQCYRLLGIAWAGELVANICVVRDACCESRARLTIEPTSTVRWMLVIPTRLIIRCTRPGRP